MDAKGLSMMQKKVFTLEELAQFTRSHLVGNPAHQISNVADLDSADVADASFLANPNYEQAMRKSRAGVIFVAPQINVIEGRNFLIHENPSKAFQQVIEAFCEIGQQQLSGFASIHHTAEIHETASIGKSVTVGPRAVIDKNAVIGDHTFIGAGCYIGPGAILGENCTIHPNVTIRERCQIGKRVIIQPGAVIGSCGFGYTTDSQGHHIKLSQVGIVIIEDDVEIGANTTIDRARFQATCIGRGTKIDNLVQIGHGVIVGEDNIIVAQTGIAGSTKTGKHVILAGQVAVAGHLSLGDGVVIAGKSGISKSIVKAGKYGGIPVLPLEVYNRNSVYLRNIEVYVKQIKKLDNRIRALEMLISTKN
jgi:UDP-3-O-[3-hydroxymyristoyl] glucosamine N-acyltransferase